MTELVLDADTGALLRPEDVSEYTQHPANHGRVFTFVCLRAHVSPAGGAAVPPPLPPAGHFARNN